MEGSKCFINLIYIVRHVHAHVYVHDTEPQLPWLRTAIYHTGLDVQMEVTQCAVCMPYVCLAHQLDQLLREVIDVSLRVEQLWCVVLGVLRVTRNQLQEIHVEF